MPSTLSQHTRQLSSRRQQAKHSARSWKQAWIAVPAIIGRHTSVSRCKNMSHPSHRSEPRCFWPCPCGCVHRALNSCVDLLHPPQNIDGKTRGEATQQHHTDCLYAVGFGTRHLHVQGRVPVAVDILASRYARNEPECLLRRTPRYMSAHPM